jgi:hypothetical protein
VATDKIRAEGYLYEISLRMFHEEAHIMLADRIIMTSKTKDCYEEA